MTTIIAAYSGTGTCIGRCDARCHNATGPICHCVCGGLNHGVGAERALANTFHATAKQRAAWDAWLDDAFHNAPAGFEPALPHMSLLVTKQRLPSSP